MCHFFSFVITEDGRFLTGNGNSHSGIETGWNLKPGSYREAEWLDESPDRLVVRGTDKSDEDWFKSAVLAKFNKRSQLLTSIIEGKSWDNKYWLKDGLFHKTDGPAVEWANGNKSWFQNGLLHRTDGPAVECADGDKHWFQNGLLHRTDGPAVEWANGDKSWYQNGLLHRTDGPAIEWVNGDKFWYQNGQRHRTDGPAVKFAYGRIEYWLEGRKVKNISLWSRIKTKIANFFNTDYPV